MRFLLLMSLLGFILPAGAQQYMIRHDLNNFKTSYYKIDDRDTTRIKNVNVKKNGRILLRIDNYNPFYWNAKVTAEKNPEAEESGQTHAFNPISLLASGMGDFIGSLPFPDMPQTRSSGSDAQSRFINTAGAYADNYQKLQELGDKHDQLKFVKLQLAELKMDITKTEAEIKAEARKVIRNVLQTDTLNLVNSFEIGKKYTNELRNALNAVDDMNNQLQQQLPLVNPEVRIDGKSFKEIAYTASTTQAMTAQLRSMQQKNPSFLLEDVVEVANLYREIDNARYFFSYAVNSEPSLSHLKLELIPKDGESKDTVVQYFPLNGKRSIKIRNSVGMAFTYFTANNTKYYIGIDSTIQKSGNNLFNPLVSTFIHFYSGNTGGFKWGGAFGFGIPLTGEKKDINFLLGLTTAFGQNEPILLTVGLSGAKVDKLTNGNKVGDKTKETIESRLVSSGYDIGGFLSLTFNLSSLSVGKK